MLRKFRRSLPLLLITALLAAMVPCLSGCGTVRTHYGIEHDWGYDFDDGHHYHKPPKHKKHKKYKKYKKQKKHHHHHDDDDD